MNCCAEEAACKLDPTCSGLYTCLDSCAGESGCQLACKSEHRRENLVSGAMLKCRAQHCALECGLPCGNYPLISESCNACLSATGCCEAQRACVDDPSCTAFVSCPPSSNADPVYKYACEREYAEAEEIVAPLLKCVGACMKVCQAAGDFTCLGKVPAPTVLGAKTANISLSLYSPLDSTPPTLPLTVQICRDIDPDCSMPLAPDYEVDELGAVHAALSLINNTEGFLGFARTLENDTYPQHFLKFKRAIYGDTAFGWVMYRKSELPFFSSLTGEKIDPERGFLTVIARDCSDFDSPFVDVAVDLVDAKTSTFWVTKQFTLSKTKDIDKITGTVIFMNLPPGNAKVTVTVSATGALHSQTTIPIRKGTISGWVAVPMP